MIGVSPSMPIGNTIKRRLDHPFLINGRRNRQ
jgi:hypothetical protein